MVFWPLTTDFRLIQWRCSHPWWDHRRRAINHALKHLPAVPSFLISEYSIRCKICNRFSSNQGSLVLALWPHLSSDVGYNLQSGPWQVHCVGPAMHSMLLTKLTTSTGWLVAGKAQCSCPKLRQQQYLHSYTPSPPSYRHQFMQKPVHFRSKATAPCAHHWSHYVLIYASTTEPSASK